MQKTQRSPHTHTHRTIRSNNEFRKVAGYKANMQKSVAFLYINSEQDERNLKAIAFTVT